MRNSAGLLISPTARIHRSERSRSPSRWGGTLIDISPERSLHAHALIVSKHDLTSGVAEGHKAATQLGRSPSHRCTGSYSHETSRPFGLVGHERHRPCGSGAGNERVRTICQHPSACRDHSTKHPARRSPFRYYGADAFNPGTEHTGAGRQPCPTRYAYAPDDGRRVGGQGPDGRQ